MASFFRQRAAPAEELGEKSISSAASTPHDEAPPQPPPLLPRPSSYHASFFLPLFIVLNLLAWPWIAFGYVWHRDGVLASPRVASWAATRPRSVTYVATLLGTAFSALTAWFFSNAIIRFSQKWLARNKEVEIFYVSFLVTLRYKFFPWGFKELSEFRHRWHLLIIVAACILAFGFIPPGISALVSPNPYNKIVHLTGSELNFASNDPACSAWLASHSVIRSNCSSFVSQTGSDPRSISLRTLLSRFTKAITTHPAWRRTNSSTSSNRVVIASVTRHSSAGFHHLTVFRSQILSHRAGNNRSRAFNQLGGVQFASPIRGVLPMGPNGVPGFNSLSPLSSYDSHALARSSTYNYTLGLQGIDTQIACQYDTRSPVRVTEIESLTGVFETTGSCPNGVDALDSPRYWAILSRHTLGFWACGLGDPDPADNSFRSYNLYLRGFGDFNTSIANITCTIETKAAEYSATFHKQSSSFITELLPSQPSTLYPTHLIKQSVQAIGSVVSESQGFASNAMAESVRNLGAKYFGIQVGSRDDMYPKLFEYMLQGIVEYQVSDQLTKIFMRL